MGYSTSDYTIVGNDFAERRHGVAFLESVCKIGEEENGSNGDHGSEIGGTFLIASGNATEMLETIDETFHDISLSVVCFIEWASALFIAATSDGATNMVTMKIGSKGTAGVAFICHQTHRS